MRERPQDMNTLDVLAVGRLVKEDGIILEAHSTSTLIRSGNVNIVVDTSSTEMLPAIKTSFRQVGVLPKDVSIVVLTHTHHDHCGNNDLFKKAKFYVHTEECPEGRNYVPVSEDVEIAPGVRLVYTPGHTEGSMSVFVDSERNYAITGDAIPLEDNYRRGVPPGINYDPGLAMKSIKYITEYADVMIPGHGFPFMGDKRR
ncbi:MAG: MBL fold metallo-hydrolase [Methanomassiliicoccaceae archaeon]|jgi:glyoxylase-like metal-dependent hydrolase (beta-lactamase superfamily II)|nr:MBL fold metallo-hydrolase [Methanomassiliicoccaceae archaeon]